MKCLIWFGLAEMVPCDQAPCPLPGLLNKQTRLSSQHYMELVQGVPEVCTRCSGSWYKMFRELVQGVPGVGTRCSGSWCNVSRELVQGVPKIGTRCSGSWYKVFRKLVQGEVIASKICANVK